MKEIVSKEQLAQVTKLSRSNPLMELLVKFAGIKDLNALYDRASKEGGQDFIPFLLNCLEVKVDCLVTDLEKIPSSGPFIVVCNHPFGALDGLALIATIGKVRPDLKVMANFLLEQVPEIRHHFIGVNPFDRKISEKSSFQGIKSAFQHLNSGHPLAIFPSGEVSTFQWNTRTIADAPWSKQSIKLIQKSKVPVIPLFFDGSNSKSFHLLGVIHPALRTLRLPKEMIKKRGQTIRLRIGQGCSPDIISDFKSSETLGKYLRARVYAMGSGLAVKKEHFRRIHRVRKQEEVQTSPLKEKLIDELNECQDLLLFRRESFECYLAPAHRIPEVLQEIGIQRELTFRKVGEGSNKSIDLDEYDYFYQHLFLWDRSEGQLVGAYRVGLGAEIMPRFGSKGFYTASLFRYKKPFRDLLSSSVELGRSFIQTAYQKHRLPLFLLWKGILLVLMKHSKHHYLIGPVSISNDYSDFSKGLMMEFIKRYHFQDELAQYVRPKNEFSPKPSSVDQDALLSSTNKDLKKLDRLIADIEPNSFTVPVLLKKYLLQNAKILGFNTDPKFNNALDGLIFLDFKDIPESTIATLKKDLEKVLT